MTERPASVTTQSATSNNVSLHNNSVNDVPMVIESAEEEPYTIKCICDFSDDDGNTIYCEKCDTWQHIECFYPGRVDDASREDFDHSCADCKPRPLDRRHATERQKYQRQNKTSNVIGIKKLKRLPSRSYKRKSKIQDNQTSIFHDQDNHKNGFQEQQSSVKKIKGNRLSLSISNQNKKSPSQNSRIETTTHPHSPIQTPPHLPINFQIHGYSDNFLNLYNQYNIHSTCTNSFASLSVSNSMTDWLRDQSRLYQDAGVRDKEDVFLNLKVSVDTLKWPELRVERKEETFQNTVLSWQYLITARQLPHPGRIVELNGLVGFQKDYCNDPENRWTESAHPRPFVFFHPRLPLCIDTRREGSIGRYVRRSCRSNTSLETFIASGTEYHFWLTSEQPLAANEQITISWDFRFPPQYRTRFLHLLNLGDDDSSPLNDSDITQEEYDQLTQIIHLVLSDHGGCACDLHNDCAFSRFHRNYLRNSFMQNNEVKSKKIRKTRPLQTSPTKTENYMINRMTSEYHQEKCEEDDNRSSTSSIRSKTQSRDLTPAITNGDAKYFLTEPSDREKRKLAMLEDSFRKMEQALPARKKKRASENGFTNPLFTQPVAKPRQRSILTSGLPNKTSSSNNNNTRPHRLDTNVSWQKHGSTSCAKTQSDTIIHPMSTTSQYDSPTSQPTKISLLKKPQYEDSSTQTDDIRNAWWKESRTKKRKSIVSLAKRLLLNRYQKDNNNSKEINSLTYSDNSPDNSEVPGDNRDAQTQDLKLPSCLSSPTKQNSHTFSNSTIVDVNSYNFLSRVTSFTSSTNNTLLWSNQNNCGSARSDTALNDSPHQMQAPLLTPVFSTKDSEKQDLNSIYPLTMIEPTTSTFDNAKNFQSPLVNGILQQPSSVKTTKKLSLSDYKAARMKKTDLSSITPKTHAEEKSSDPKHATFESSSLISVQGLRTSVTLDRLPKKENSPTEKTDINNSLEA